MSIENVIYLIICEVICACMVFLGVDLFIRSIRNDFAVRFGKNHVEAEGTIIKFHHVGVGKGSHWNPIIKFEYNGKEFISEEKTHAIKVYDWGEKVTVCFIPNDEGRIVIKEKYDLEPLKFLWGIAFVIVGIICAITCFIKVQALV